MRKTNLIMPRHCPDACKHIVAGYRRHHNTISQGIESVCRLILYVLTRLARRAVMHTIYTASHIVIVLTPSHLLSTSYTNNSSAYRITSTTVGYLLIFTQLCQPRDWLRLPAFNANRALCSGNGTDLDAKVNEIFFLHASQKMKPLPGLHPKPA